jgi:hypothetical protein
MALQPGSSPAPASPVTPGAGGTTASHPAGGACAAEPAAATSWRWPPPPGRASTPRSELQDFRGSKRDALARTPPSAPAPERPSPAESRKKTRGTGALQAALAATAPAAAAPQPPTATSPHAAALADANPYRLLA